MWTARIRFPNIYYPAKSFAILKIKCTSAHCTRQKAWRQQGKENTANTLCAEGIPSLWLTYFLEPHADLCYFIFVKQFTTFASGDALVDIYPHVVMEKNLMAGPLEQDHRMPLDSNLRAIHASWDIRQGFMHKSPSELLTSKVKRLCEKVQAETVSVPRKESQRAQNC